MLQALSSHDAADSQYALPETGPDNFGVLRAGAEPPYGHFVAELYDKQVWPRSRKDAL